MVAGRVDIGSEPPLNVGENVDNTPIRRAVSLRWLSGTILTGVTSIALMGGALMVALDGRHQLAVPPESAAARPQDRAGLAYGTKGDRIRPTEPVVSSRQIVQVSTVTRQGDRDVIRLKPFVRISASLSLRRDGFTADIPAYDPLKIFAAGTVEPAPEQAQPTERIADAQVDGEMAVRFSPFPEDEALDFTVDFKTAEVEEILRDAVGMTGEESDLAPLAYVDTTRPAATGRRGSSRGGDPFTALGVSIVPENVTQVAKNDGRSESLQEKVAVVTAKESFGALLKRNAVPEADAADITIALGDLVDLARLRPGQKVRIGYVGSALDGGLTRPMRVSIYDDGAHQATVARTDSNRFVRADAPSDAQSAFADAAPEKNSGPMPRLYEAIYQTALEQDVPRPTIAELIRVLSYEVDYQSQIGPGDAIEIFHAAADPSEAEATPEEGIVYASITLGGAKRRFYRFRTPDDGIVDYYDADGRSAKKFLMRKPMTAGVFRSGYGYRRHPILGYRKLHTGVDWAASRGTPILAAGDGVVEKAGRTSGYGNYTMIRHTNGYETAYGHQSAFAKGVVPGARVRQGQVIGYVGSTGLSTGPHLHYEVRVNGKLVDPLRIRLPRGRVLQGEMLANFERERERIDALLTHPAAGTTKVASAESR